MTTNHRMHGMVARNYFWEGLAADIIHIIFLRDATSFVTFFRTLRTSVPDVVMQALCAFKEILSTRLGVP